MPISFPSTPTNGQQVTTGGKTYQWNGRFWKAIASPSAGGGGASSWTELADKPTEFTPAAHTQSISSITGLTGALDSLATDIAGKQPSGPYLTTETDPVFSASAAAGITSTNTSNWNTAYGWGNHASAGYLLPASIGVSVQGYNANTVIDGSYVHTDNNFTTALLNKLNGIEAGATAGGGANYTISATAPNPATYPIWFTLNGKQHVWDGEAWFEVPGTPGADGQDGAPGADGADGGGGGSPILSWVI